MILRRQGWGLGRVYNSNDWPKSWTEKTLLHKTLVGKFDSFSVYHTYYNMSPFEHSLGGYFYLIFFSEYWFQENSIRHWRGLYVSMVLHQDQLRRVRPMSTRLRRRLYAFSIAWERLLDLDKEYGMKRWCTRRDKFLDFNPNFRLQQDGRLSRMLCTFSVDIKDWLRQTL